MGNPFYVFFFLSQCARFSPLIFSTHTHTETPTHTRNKIRKNKKMIFFFICCAYYYLFLKHESPSLFFKLSFLLFPPIIIMKSCHHVFFSLSLSLMGIESVRVCKCLFVFVSLIRSGISVRRSIEAFLYTPPPPIDIALCHLVISSFSSSSSFSIFSISQHFGILRVAMAAKEGFPILLSIFPPYSFFTLLVVINPFFHTLFSYFFFKIHSVLLLRCCYAAEHKKRKLFSPLLVDETLFSIDFFLFLLMIYQVLFF